MGGQAVQEILKAFTNAVFETIRILQIQNPVLNVATVDVPGVITSLLRRLCKHELYLFGCSITVYIGLLWWRLFISAWVLTLSVRLD